MAEQMQSIQRRMKSIHSTERITNAMKLVSAAKLRKSKMAFESAQIYLRDLVMAIRHTFDEEENMPNCFLAGSRELKTKCLVVITSSNGLCGSFNSNVIKATEEELKRSGIERDHVKMATIGSKGKDYFVHRGVEIMLEHNAPADTVTFEESKAISGPLIDAYLKGEIDEINIVYTAYINPLRQEVRVKKLLPIDILETEEPVKYKHVVSYEPSAEEVFRYMVPKYIELVIFGACIESATCEYAARRTAMESANDNAKEMLEALQLAFNHARQAAITNEIIEVVAGSEANQ